MKKRPANIFYGWWIVLGGGFMQFYASAVFWRGFQAFVDPILATTGWSRAAFAAAVSIQRGESGLISPFVGVALDRFGPKVVMIFGVIVTGFGFIAMSLMQNLWHFYASVLLLALGMSFGTFIVFVATVGNWFVRRRARAFAVLMTFSAVGAIALPPLVWLIDTYGWRPILFGVGVGFWIIGIPVALMMRRRPEDFGQLPDGEADLRGIDENGQSRTGPREISIGVREVLRLRAFWQISIAVSIGQLVSSTNLFHLPALIEYEISAWLAASAAGAVAIGDILGRAGIGFIGDRFDKKLLLAGSFLIQMLGVAALAAINSDYFGIEWGLIPLPIFIIGFGLGFGASIPLRLAILADYFGRRSYGSVVGIASSVSAVFGTIGPLFVGLMFDITGSYRPAYAVMAIVMLVALPLIMTLESQTRTAAKVRQAARNRVRRLALRR